MTEERDPNDSVLALIERVRGRDAAGWASYGRPLNPWDGRNTAEDALEEAIDLAMYQMKAIQERKDVVELLMQGGYLLTSIEDNVPEALKQKYFSGSVEDLLSSKLFAMAERLRADIPRIGSKSEAELERETWAAVKGPSERLADMSTPL